MKRKLARTGVPLGLRPDTTYKSSEEVPLERGDMVLLLTDGIEESISPEDELYGNDRIMDLVRRHRDKTAHEVLDALYREVREFSGGQPQSDDVTAIVFRVL